MSVRVGSDFASTVLSDLSALEADSNSSLNSEAYYAQIKQKENQAIEIDVEDLDLS